MFPALAWGQVIDLDKPYKLRTIQITGQGLFGDGSVTAPGISFINNPTTGFFQASDQLSISIAGTQKYTIDATRIRGQGAGSLMSITFGSISSTAPLYQIKNDENTGIGWAGADSLSLIAGGVEGIRIAEGGGKMKTTVTDTLEISGDGVFLYTPPHGMLSFHDSATTLTMSTGNWAHITNVTASLFAETDLTDITFAGDSMTIDAGKAGDYIMNIGLSFAGTASDDYEITLFKNHVQTGPIMEVETGGTTNTYIGLHVCVPNLAAGDDLKLMIRNTASNDDATVLACSWTVFMLHR